MTEQATELTLSDEQVIALCRSAGITWLVPDADPDGFPGSFDMVSMPEMRALLAAWNRRSQGKSDPTDDEIRKEWNRTQDPIATVRAVLAARRPAPPAAGLYDALPPTIEGRLNVWLTLGKELNPHTVNLVVRFARALASKLADAEKKYGYSDGWLAPDWMEECRAKLMEHIDKGDPRDVAAYCAFLWHHGESTAPLAIPAPPAAGVPSALAKALQRGYEGSSFVTSETPTLRLYYSTNEEAEAAHDALMDAIDALATSGAPADGVRIIAKEPLYTASGVQGTSSDTKGAK